jgi:hypothetical protein
VLIGYCNVAVWSAATLQRCSALEEQISHFSPDGSVVNVE